MEIRTKTKKIYYCKLCSYWHSAGSEVYKEHKVYASQQRRLLKTTIKTKSFWEKW